MIDTSRRLIQRLKAHKLLPAEIPFTLLMNTKQHPGWRWHAINALTQKPFPVGGPTAMKKLLDAAEWDIDRDLAGNITVSPKGDDNGATKAAKRNGPPPKTPLVCKSPG